MKTIKYILCSLLLLSGLYGCKEEKKEMFQKEQVYSTSQVEFKLRSMDIKEKVEPANQNEKFSYLSLNGSVAIDIQFYIENKTDQKIDIHDHLSGELIVDGQQEQEVCVENDHYTNIDERAKLEPKQKSIAHLLFWIDDSTAKYVQENHSEIEMIIDKKIYTLKYENIKTQEESLQREQKLEFDDFDLTVLSGSASKIIPALNFEGEYDYYECENKEKQYAGGYIEIANKTNLPFNLLERLPVYLNIEGQDNQTMWFTILSQDEARFEDGKVIPANQTRKVLIFTEVPLDYEDTDYTFHFVIDGKNYEYTYTHIVIAR